MKRRVSLPIAAALAAALLALPLCARPATDDDTAGLALFDHKAALSKELGATHIVITEGLPPATWEMDAADPYPAWYVHHASLLTIFPPPEVEPYVDKAYAARVSAILEKRCEILRKYGLKAVWNANEPAVMPEAFFTAYPQLRGPRIDQPNRSRKARFAPSVDEPETLLMYRESMQLLLKAVPGGGALQLGDHRRRLGLRLGALALPRHQRQQQLQGPPDGGSRLGLPHQCAEGR